MYGVNVNVNISTIGGMTQGIGTMQGYSPSIAFKMLASLMTQFNSGLTGMTMGMGTMGIGTMGMGTMGMGTMGYGIGAPPMNNFYGLMNGMGMGMNGMGMGMSMGMSPFGMGMSMGMNGMGMGMGMMNPYTNGMGMGMG
ncbi:MAG TPA: hypothetical protein PL055_02435, partial [Methanobacterium sp.]|nr:hypothetical protein [Methanobacterium sp.]